MKNKAFIILSFVLFPLIVSLACTCGLLPIGGDKVEETEEQVLVIPSVTVVEERPTEEITITEEVAITEETLPVETEGEIIETGENLVLQKENWGTKDEYTFVGFMLYNQNKNMSLTDVEYTISLLDSTGQEIMSDWNTFPTLLPEEKLAVFYTTPIDEDDPPVHSVDVTYGYEDTQVSDRATSPFSTEKIKYWEDNMWPIVSGLITNSDLIVYTDVRAGILLYNAAGDVVGGGTAYIDFIPGQDSMGFSSYVDAYDTVASVEVFPTITYSTYEYDDSVELWERASILDYYFFTGEFNQLFGGAIIQNNLETLLQDAIVTVNFFDEDGYVTCYGSQFIDYLMPGEKLGVSPYIYSQPDGATATNFTIFIFPGEPVEDYELTENVFVVNSAELTGEYQDQVKVNFTNTYTKQASEVAVYALLYDQEGLIIGGGNGYFNEPIPAGESRDYEFYVNIDSETSVSEIEAWVLPNYWTAFE